MNYRNVLNAQGRKSLCKSPIMPADNLAVGEDEPHGHIPLKIQKDRHLPAKRPVIQNFNSIPFEKTVEKGSGETLSINDFVTDDFAVGQAFA